MTKKRNDNQSDEIAKANSPLGQFEAISEIGKAKRRLRVLKAALRVARKQLIETRNRYDWAHDDEYTGDENALSNTEFLAAKRQSMEAREHYDYIHRESLAAELDLIYLHSKNGQQTVWQFVNIERNQPLADSLFEFVAPANIEVIENTYSQ